MVSGDNCKVMYIGPYTPWEHYPKLLRYDEVQHPLDVVEDFFNVSDLEGHRKLLKEWRDFVIAERYYAHKCFGPGSLLFTHEVNLKLLEASYLLSLNHEHHWPRPEPISEEDLAEERAEWEEQPENLAHKELLNPYKAIKKVFKKPYSLPAYRDHLAEWLTYALSIKTNEEEIRAHEFIPVYENLLKLYDAAWLIRLRAKKASKQQKPLTTTDEEDNRNSQVNNAVTLKEPIKEIAPDLTAASKLGLDEVVDLITKKITGVRSIILLGTHPSPYTYYLVVLLDDSERVAEHEVGNRIEDLCRPLVSVITIVHKVSVARQAIPSGSRFWNNTLSKGLVVYQVPEFSMPAFHLLPRETFVEKSIVDWERWGVQGKEFMKGAKYYIDNGNYTLGAFMLHQAAESALIAIIKAVTGYRFSAHNLSRMIRMTLLFTEELKNVFELNTTEGSQVFNLLQVAYSEARYRGSFVADEELVRQLLPKVELFLATTQAVYEAFVDDPD